MSLYKYQYNRTFIQIEKPILKVTPKKPWMSKGLLISCRKKDKLYLKYRKCPTEANKIKYSLYRNKFKMLRIKAEKMYYEKEFNKYAHDSKRTWKVIKTLINGQPESSMLDALKIDGRIVTDPAEIAHSFNGFFSGIGHSLAQKIPKGKNSIYDYMRSPEPTSFGLLPTSPQEIINLANLAKYSRSPGPDGIDPLIARKTIGSVAGVVSAIINSSFETGIIPPDLKIANITPIFKQGDKMSMTNYRPVSVLSYFAKIMEKAMCDRLTGYINIRDVLYPSQYGFRTGHTTDMALINIQDLITKAIDTSTFSIGIFLDLAKAFDTVDHRILLKKLEYYGIRGTPLLWFKNYLDSRFQQVRCNGALSSLKPIRCGVPQGSNLGPLLFLIYINDLPSSSSVLKFILFADDTNAFCSHKSLTELKQIINTELVLLAEWFKTNRLSLNVKKTSYITFHSPNKTILDPGNKLFIEGIAIEQVSSTKFLGIYI